MDTLSHLFDNNRAWSERLRRIDPEFFARLSRQQRPRYLWIGCADSRVPANEITGTQPGEIFVHRNIANMVVHTDLNLLAVLAYAVEHLKVKHVIVCGHYGCGGVKAAMSHHNLGIINKWLRNIKDVFRFHERELLNIQDEELRVNRLVELNVQEQVLHLAKTSIIQRAWKNEQRPDLHGWVYGLQNGIINPIFEMAPGDHIDPIYEFDNL